MNTIETYRRINPNLELSLHEENQAFPLEKLATLPPQAIEKHAKTYLGEYRLRLSIDDYALAFDGKLKGEYESEPLSFQALRAIEARRVSNETTHREHSDLQGILSLENQLVRAGEGDAVLWASPPELGHKYCGEYGYIYAGRVGLNDYSSSVKHLDMFSYRIEESNLDLYNIALSRLIGEETSFVTPEDFIVTPVVMPSLAEPDIERVLFEVFGFYIPKEEAVKKEQTLRMVEGHMDSFVTAVISGKSRSVQSQKFHKLEWYATKVWEQLGSVEERQLVDDQQERYLSAERLVGFYDGSALEVVRGSCGASGAGVGSPNYNSLSSEGRLTAEQAKKDPKLCRCSAVGGPHFHCDGKKDKKKCNHAIEVGKNITRCSNCGAGKKC